MGSALQSRADHRGLCPSRKPKGSQTPGVTQARVFGDRGGLQQHPMRLRAVPSHCPQAPLAAGATWLAGDFGKLWEELSPCGRSWAAGAVLRGQVSVGCTCLRSAALGGAALGKINLERSQFPSSSLQKTGSGGGRADHVQTSLLQTQTGTGQRGLGLSQAAPWTRDGGERQGWNSGNLTETKKGFGPFAPVCSPSAPELPGEPICTLCELRGLGHVRQAEFAPLPAAVVADQGVVGFLDVDIIPHAEHVTSCLQHTPGPQAPP